MDKSKVYFYKDSTNFQDGLNKFFRKIAEEIGDTEEKIGIKIHFGAQNNDTHIDPKLLNDLPKIFKNPIYVESNCLYPGRRHRSDEHIKLAQEHGFTNLQIDILDGKEGRDYTEIEIDTKNTKKAKISTGLNRYKNLISVAHFKGHMAAGFGGALKNLSMGCAARGGKLDMHAGVSPRISTEECTACGECAENCIADAIEVNEYAIIDQKKCVGCAYCISVCQERAIKIPFGSRSGIEFVEKLAEYTLAVIQGHNWWYINVLNNITLKCDCMRIKQTPFMEDIGILYSKNPIAIDQASLDLVTEYNNGINPFKGSNQNSEYILEYGEELGLGIRKYELIEID